MKKQIALLVLFFFVVLQGCKKDDIEPDYSDKFTGVWKGVRITQNGQTANIQGNSSISFTATFTRVETNKLKLSMVNFIGGQTTTLASDDIITIKNIDINNYELQIPNSNVGGNLYITLNVNTGELKVGGFTSGNAFEYVYKR